jgi:hypothetical protein
MNNNFINKTPIVSISSTPISLGLGSNILNNTQNVIKSMTNSILASAQALGFDTQAAEKQFKLELNANSFLKPNPRAFEILIHFMLSQLDAERAERIFAQCWPPLTKDQQKEFKEVIYSWLTEISAANKLQQFSKHQQSLLANIRVPSVAKSLLVSPGGLKTCELLFSLIQYVTLVKVLRLSK